MFICGFISGCRAQPSNNIVGYFGATDPLPKVIADVNLNNQRLTTLAASGSFDAWLKQGNQTNYLNGTVSMAYAGPKSLRMFGKKDIVGDVFELGSNNDRFWMIERQNGGTMYTGTYANMARVNPNEIPIRPDLVLEVLGVQSIPVNFLQQPVPVMRFNNDNDAYMILWNTQLDDRWVAQKEVWYDRATKLPKAVLLYDPDGRIILSAYLADHQPVRTDDVPREQWPMVATSYRLFFPDSGTVVHFSLKEDLASKRNGKPDARSFTYPGLQNAGVSRVRDFDESPSP